jgi:hypothetical protein
LSVLTRRPGFALCRFAIEYPEGIASRVSHEVFPRPARRRIPLIQPAGPSFQPAMCQLVKTVLSGHAFSCKQLRRRFYETSRIADRPPNMFQNRAIWERMVQKHPCIALAVRKTINFLDLFRVTLSKKVHIPRIYEATISSRPGRTIVLPTGGRLTTRHGAFSTNRSSISTGQVHCHCRFVGNPDRIERSRSYGLEARMHHGLRNASKKVCPFCTLQEHETEAHHLLR